MWQVAVNGQVLGTMNREQVQASLQSGQLSTNAYVTGGNLPDWTPIAHVPELAELVANDVVPAMAPANMNAATSPQLSPADAYANVGKQAPTSSTNAETVPAGPGPGPQSGDWLKERTDGVKSIGLGLLLLAVNFGTIWFLDAYYPVTVIFAVGSFGHGGWVMIFGDEYDDKTMELVKWKRYGMWTFAVIGGILGLILSGFLGA